jgi:uncharacterized protein (TIGR03086 family)
MSDPQASYERIADGFAARVDGVEADGWDGVTPCPDWTVRELVAHVVRTHRGVVANLDDVEAEPVDPEGDLGAQWGEARQALEAALDDEGRSSRIVGGLFGDQTFESLVHRLVCTDTLIHTWDLARATGQDESLDSEGVSFATAVLADLDDAIRVPGGFGAAIAPAVGADAQTRFLNFCGRAV